MPLSTFLRDSPLTGTRGLMFLALEDQATIMRRSATSDQGGGAAYTWQAAGTAACRVYPVTLRGKPGALAGRINERTTHFCVTPPDTTILPADRIMVSGRGTFEVTMVLERTSRLSAVCEVFQLV